MNYILLFCFLFFCYFWGGGGQGLCLNQRSPYSLPWLASCAVCWAWRLLKMASVMAEWPKIGNVFYYYTTLLLQLKIMSLWLLLSVFPSSIVCQFCGKSHILGRLFISLWHNSFKRMHSLLQGCTFLSVCIPLKYPFNACFAYHNKENIFLILLTKLQWPKILVTGRN